MKVSKGFKGSLIFGFDGDGHPFLAFGNQDFPGRKAGLLERDLGKVNFASVGVFSHLANGGGESSCTVVGNAGDEVGIPRFQHHVEHFFLRDGVADLHSA